MFISEEMRMDYEAIPKGSRRNAEGFFHIYCIPTIRKL